MNLEVSILVSNNVINDARVLREATSLNNAGCKVRIFGVKDSPNNESRISINGIKITRIEAKETFSSHIKPLNTIVNVYRNNMICKRIKKEAIKYKSDIVHANDIDMLSAGYKIAKRHNAFFIYDSHELFVSGEKPHLSNPFLLFSKLKHHYWSYLENKYLKTAHKVITVNKAIAKELSKRYGIEEPEVVMNCPPLYKLTDINNSPLRLTLKKKYPEKKYVLYQGLVSPVRGLEKVIESIKELPEAVFAILGHGKKGYKERLKLFSKRAGVEERVVILDPVEPDELLDWTKGADIGIHAPKNIGLSYYLSTPNKLFEYMMAGLPVAVSNFPEMKRIVEKEKCGVTFDPEDPKDIAEKIKYILENEERRKEMARNARRAAEEKYNWEEQEKVLLKAYEEIPFK